MVSTSVDESAIQEDIAAHHRRNATLVQQIRQRGGDSQRKRPIDCFFHTRTEDDAIALSRLLQSRGLRELSITGSEEASDHPWTVQGTLTCSIAAFTGIERVEEFVRIAVQHDAVFDGWGTSLDESAQTI
jgi:Regulator of ribonuclease activity B